MLRWIAPWAVLAAILGFALGGSFAWCLLDSPLEGNHQSESYDSAKDDNRAANGERGTARNPLVVEIAPTPESQSFDAVSCKLPALSHRGSKVHRVR